MSDVEPAVATNFIRKIIEDDLNAGNCESWKPVRIKINLNFYNLCIYPNNRAGFYYCKHKFFSLSLLTGVSLFRCQSIYAG